jgi:iron complex outermembrane recepter protein
MKTDWVLHTSAVQKIPLLRLKIIDAGVFIILFATYLIAIEASAQVQAVLPVQQIVITAPAPLPASAIGIGATPLQNSPLSATVVGAEQIKEVGATRLADLYKLDASVSDAYNAVGYIDYATVRGFVIDNKSNYKRDGLPISGDTAIGLANKERVEILHGTSGLQTGVSSPGGVVNYVLKRPPRGSQRIMSWSESLDKNGQFGAAFDAGGRVSSGQLGYRLNVAANRLSSSAKGTTGSQWLAALALDARLGDALLEGEVELSRQSQPSVPGLSVLGNTLPAPDPKLNLNRQSWSQPSVFAGQYYSLRYSQPVGQAWRGMAQWSKQRLHTDDRIAFPFGCSASNVFDRYCANGNVDIYDYRSEGEKRHKDALLLKLEGKTELAGLKHDLSFSVQQARGQIVLPDNAFNYAGMVNVSQATTPVPATPGLIAGSGNNQTDRSTELAASDAISMSPDLKAWLGLRHTRLQTSDAKAASSGNQRFTTPWLALSYKLGKNTLYASSGQGIETRVVPNLPAYGAQAGVALPVQRSRQLELGIKGVWGDKARSHWAVTGFQIRRPLVQDTGTALLTDGVQQHRGIELAALHVLSVWQLSGSATVLNATQQDAVLSAAFNGLKPTNVPSYIVRANAAYRLSESWQLGVHLSHEGKRAVLPDNSIFLPAWTRLDASAQWQASLLGSKSSVRLGIDNLLNKRFYQESPFQFGHAYAFPAQPRRWRISVNTNL